jgi:hypothetical protein
MNVYLAGSGWEKICWADRGFYDFYRLESFVYLSQFERTIIKEYKGFLLDSGAFTYLNKAGGACDWEKYVIEYGQFIKKFDVQYFFELDIDPIVGIKEVERLRGVLESVAERKCIPVWHKSRGLEYWENITKEYDYVAIGGIVTKEIKKAQHDIFTPLLNIAKLNACKVHGLGFTSLLGVEKYSFFSVDSTAWLSGNRFGHVYFFNGQTLLKYDKKPGQRVKTYEVAKHNFNEWVKFQKYAEKKL